MSAHLPEVIWIGTSPRPLCDVPWLGTSVVLSDGSVDFCCFSSAVVGNVNQEPFGKIWSGPVMQRIRQALSDQQFPPECKSNSCPIYRGDKESYIVDRMNGIDRSRMGGDMDPRAQARDALQQSTLLVNRIVIGDDALLQAEVNLHSSGPPLECDLYVAVPHPDGSIRFLPDLEEYAIPYSSPIRLRQAAESLRITVFQQQLGSFQLTGEYLICAALFENESNPNLLANCYWSSAKPFTLTQEDISRRSLTL